MDYVNIFIEGAFVQNLALTFFLGMCMFLAVSKRMDTALGFGLAVFIVQTITVPINNLLYRYLLRSGALEWAGLGDVDLSFLGLITYVGVIAAVVQILEIFIERVSPALFQAFGIFLPLLTVNCAILGGSLFMVQRNYTLAESVAYGAGTGFGWALAIALLASIRERLKYSDPPEGLRGLGLAFIVAGLVSLSFMAFPGIRLG